LILEYTRSPSGSRIASMLITFYGFSFLGCEGASSEVI
jgi:hypothetical protein